MEDHMNFTERPILGLDKGLYPKDDSVRKVLHDSLAYTDLKGRSKQIYKSYIDNMSENYTQELFKRFELNVPVIGIRIFASDLSIISAFALIIFCTWSFFCVRREAHLTKQIEIEFNSTKNANSKKYLYYGAIFENVFATATEDNIRPKIKSEKFLIKIFNYITFLVSPKIIMAAIRTLPIITIGLTYWSDVINSSAKFTQEYYNEILARQIICLFAMVYIFTLLYQIFKLDIISERRLKEMHNMLNAKIITSSSITP